MKGIINIFGEIGEQVQLIDIITQVKKQPEATRFDVVIDSPGGVVSIGFQIYNYLRSLGVPLTTIGQNMVASIATVIFMAGDKRKIRKNTGFMIHLPMGGIQGTAEEIENFSKVVKKVENQVLKFYSENFGLSKEAIEPLLKNETWLSEEHLTELGIVTTSRENKIAAIFKSSKNENKSTTKTKEMADSKDTNIIDKIKSIIAEYGKDEKKKDDVQNKFLFDSNNRKVIFPELKEDEVVSQGDRAVIDEKPAEGEILLQDGRTIVFASGKVEKIVEAEDPKDAEIAALKADKKKLEEQITALKDEVKAEKSKFEKADAIIAKLKDIESADADDTNDKKKKTGEPAKESRFAKAIKNLR